MAAGALAAFSELAAPVMGILTVRSHRSRQALVRPVVSLPVRSRTGRVRSASKTSTSPCSSVPASTIGQPRARWALTQAATSRCEGARTTGRANRSEEHTSELQSPCNLVCRLLLEKKQTEHDFGSRPHQIPASPGTVYTALHNPPEDFRLIDLSRDRCSTLSELSTLPIQVRVLLDL